MAPMAAVCGYDNVHLTIGYLETTSIGIQMKKQIVLTWIYISMMNLWSDTENSW